MRSKILVLVVLGLLAACGGSDSTPNDGDASLGDAAFDDGGSTDAAGDTSSLADGATDVVSDALSETGVDASDGAPPTACDTYCATIMSNCVGANAQYPSLASCVATCGVLPAGSASDTSSNTVGCRSHYAGLAGAAPATNCASAGPTGGDVVVSDTTPGVCGEGCDALCTITQAICTGINKQYADKDVCLGACKSSLAALKSPPYSTADTTANDYGCRTYHVTAAAGGSSSTVSTECPYTVPNSSMCTM